LGNFVKVKARIMGFNKGKSVANPQ
jgi:hypothetical protein